MRHPIVASLLVAVFVFAVLTALFRGDLEALLILAAISVGFAWGARRRIRGDG
jgi:hypothetical protein